jgi:hypothetical protein
MVPNIARNGSSFRGAGAYHLHDKPTGTETRPRSAERVAFTATRNLANDDPHLALDEMWRTADDAAFLKSAASASQRGRKNVAPVKTISLAWSPAQAPTQQVMIAAADSFLRAMGWHQHQAVFVAHCDAAHPHIHIILNRIHPDTGRTLNDWQERRRAQAWALAYERENGPVLCKGRAVRYETRARAEPLGLPYRQAKLLSGSSSRSARNAVACTQRRQFARAWTQHYRYQNAQLARLADQRRVMQRLAVSLAREGDSHGAQRALNAFNDRHQRSCYALTQARTVLARAQDTNFVRLRDQHMAAPRPANDNHAKLVHVPSFQPARIRLERLHEYHQSPLNLRSLIALQRLERRQLLATQSASYGAMRQRRAARHAAALARTEVAVTFAGRWAAIRRMPPALRAPAAAALKLEEAAALSSRLAYHASRLRAADRAECSALRSVQLAERRALLFRHRLARLAAAFRSRRPWRSVPARPATGPPAPL